MADTPTGETVTPGDTQTTVQTPAAPVANASDPAEVERLRKEQEQKDLRIRQLENEAAAREKADAEAKAKSLEEKEEYKTLYEQAQALLREKDEAESAVTRQKELAAATTQVFQEYPANVVELAQTAGLKLTDDSDEAKTALKATLDAFKEKVGGSAPTATPNNPRETAPVVVDRAELTARAHPGAASPMAEASARGDDSVTLKYISQLPAIQRMKDIARNGA